MKKFVFAIFLATAACLISSCELDNYDAPDGCIRGEIIDSGTGEAMPLPVEGSTGAVISLMEVGTKASLAHSFYAKQDGSFKNSMVFRGPYTVTATGPFKMSETYDVEIGSDTELKMYAVPYSRIDMSLQVDGMKVTVNYKVTPTEPGSRISSVYVLWNYRLQTDVITGNNCSAKIDFSGRDQGSSIINISNEIQYNSNKDKIAANGGKVYFRVAADVGGNINYSKVQEVIINE